MAPVERIVLVHGSVVGGRATWREQRRAGVDGAELIVLERPGFPPGPPEDVDFDDQADWLVEQLRESDHLVGHSYGGVVALLAAARRGRGLGSLHGSAGIALRVRAVVGLPFATAVVSGVYARSGS